MTIWSFALALDTPEPGRKKEGDIIAIRPGDWEWGSKERQQYLIVLVDFGDLFKNRDEVEKLVCPLFANGEAWWPDSFAEGRFAKQPEIIGKRRYRISFADIDAAVKARGFTLNWAKVKDEQVDYQPFLKAAEGPYAVILPGISLIENKASGLKLGTADLELIRDYGKFKKIGD